MNTKMKCQRCGQTVTREYANIPREHHVRGAKGYSLCLPPPAPGAAHQVERIAARAAIIRRELPGLAEDVVGQLAQWHVEAEDVPAPAIPPAYIDEQLRGYDGANGY